MYFPRGRNTKVRTSGINIEGERLSPFCAAGIGPCWCHHSPSELWYKLQIRQDTTEVRPPFSLTPFPQPTLSSPPPVSAPEV